MSGKRLAVASARQQQLLDFIIAFKSEHDGCAPNTHEMRQALRLASTSNVAVHLGALERKGYIRLGPKRQARMIAVVGATWSPPTP